MQHASQNLGDDDRIDWIQLIRSRRVGPSTFVRLLDEHGTARGCVDALPGIAADAGVRDYRPFGRKFAHDEYWQGIKNGLTLICLADATYPPMLRSVPGAPPEDSAKHLPTRAD